MGTWTGWSRMWALVVIFFVLTAAVLNAVAFFGNSRVVFPFSSAFSKATESFPATSDTNLDVRQKPSSRNQSEDASLGLNSGPDSGHPALKNPEIRDHGIDPNKYFFVCIPILVGSDSDNPFPGAQSLPFSLLYRLFDSAKVEISKKLQDDEEKSQRPTSTPANSKSGTSLRVKILVIADFREVVCRMARDSLEDAGPEFQAVELTCLELHELPAAAGALATQPPPSPSLFCSQVVVGSSTRFQQQLSLEWARFIRWDDLKVVDLDAPDPSRSPPHLPRELWRPTVITAFSSNHLAVGLLLLRSLGRAGMELANSGQYNISIVAYTLEDFDPNLRSVLDCVIRELNENFSVPTELREFDFSSHPAWMRVNQSVGYEGAGKWAWKAVMMHEVLIDRGFVVWTDAGCRYSASALSETLNFTRDFGFASRLSEGLVPKWVHPLQLKYFRYHVKFDRGHRVRNCDTSGIGLTLDTYESIGRPFYDCSVTRQCIGPDGATRENHRFEQAAMTLIADMNGTSCRGLSRNVKGHMDYNQNDFSGTFPTHCYRDPLPVPAAGQKKFDPNA